MNFAHIVGEHHYQSTSDRLSHLMASWAGVVVAVLIGGIICYIIYQRTRKTHAKQDIKK